MNIFIDGMHGLGDNLRQRAIVKEYVRQGYTVWLTSSWVSLYHDLPINIIRKASKLRTQDKNAERERDGFFDGLPPSLQRGIRIWYPPANVRRTGSIMKAMCEVAGLPDLEADFHMPVKTEWCDSLLAKLPASVDRPIMLYRPLVDRPKDWGGCNARNPDHKAYAEIFKAIRDEFYVVSVADLKPNYEWIVGEHIEPDFKFHEGELSVEELCALTKMASLVYCSPGFAAVMGQAVGTPVICVFGGYERSSFFFDGVQRAPCIGIDTIDPCECFSHTHRCEKRIDITSALNRIGAMLQGDGM